MLKRVIPAPFLRYVRSARREWEEWAAESYSQEGEDMILKRVFEEPGIGLKQNGFYIDVGAHHPKRYSNTYLFYKNGWRGINIDAMPSSMEQFREQRPRDINIEMAISRHSGERTFYIFNEPLLNSFDGELSRSRVSDIYQIIEERTIPTRTLKEVLAEALPQGAKIDFLSIDVEGLDMEVLQSNDWEAIRPDYILTECVDLTLTEVINSELYKFLESQNYELLCKTINTVFFKKQSV